VDVRWQRRLSRAALLLLIIAAEQAVWRLGLEMMLGGSVLLVEAALEHPYWTTLLLLVLHLLATLGARDGVARHARALQVLSRVPLWLVSIVTGVLLFQILAVVGLVLSEGAEVFNTHSLHEATLQNPFLHSVNLALLGLLWFVVIRGDYRRMITLAARAFIVPGCGLALIFAAEFFWIGIIGLGVEGASSIDNYLLFGEGLLLVLVWAVGVKYVFRLPLARWAIFSASLVSVLMVLVGNALQFVPG
jgi:hypothetical protein